MIEQFVNFGEMSIGMLIGLILVSIWEVIWKGIGLWHSAQAKHKSWFIAILVINLFGLLPIIYLIWFKQDVKKAKKK
ncbi:MAG: DUF5652 family protein [Candidatus Woesearchaeota archaeon]